MLRESLSCQGTKIESKKRNFFFGIVYYRTDTICCDFEGCLNGAVCARGGYRRGPYFYHFYYQVLVR